MQRRFDRKSFDRDAFETVLRRRFFLAPAFEIYGGVAGLFDYGPPGCAMKNHLIQLWRDHFVVEEGMLEIDGPTLTPDPVLRASGHVDRFQDYMVRDLDTGACYRADHLLRETLENRIAAMDRKRTDEQEDRLRSAMETCLQRIDEMNQEQIAAAYQQFDIRAPESDAPLSAPYPFNLMFQTQIGPTGTIPAYLRPETAQGIFVNFRRLLDYNNGRMPFACAQIGLSFRNEISPRAGILRVREFAQAEIEHFVHPDRKDHPKFNLIADLELILLPRKEQHAARSREQMTTVLLRAAEAVRQGIVDNETLAYFIARTQQYAQMIGILPNHMRFRQHLESEMAHYARDCWDLEVETSYGWVECVGLADRACYDLQAHSAASKVDLVAYEKFDEPRDETFLQITPLKRVIGTKFRGETPQVLEAIEKLGETERAQLQQQLTDQDQVQLGPYVITREMVTIERVNRKIHGRSYCPSVIEPSFGIGRLLYCVLEHAFYNRTGGDELRTVLALKPAIAPVKSVVLPLSKNEVFEPVIQAVLHALAKCRLTVRLDESNVSIGRRYARADEIGVPFCVTIDFDSLVDHSVTLRERDSMEQVRGSVGDVVRVLVELVTGERSWTELVSTDPSLKPFTGQQSTSAVEDGTVCEKPTQSA
jgi:glycyl-tRNA synthetase